VKRFKAPAEIQKRKHRSSASAQNIMQLSKRYQDLKDRKPEDVLATFRQTQLPVDRLEVSNVDITLTVDDIFYRKQWLHFGVVKIRVDKTAMKSEYRMSGEFTLRVQL
jgi:hypothetical protein